LEVRLFTTSIEILPVMPHGSDCACSRFHHPSCGDSNCSSRLSGASTLSPPSSCTCRAPP
jgi:hypothetical protein